MRFISRKCRLDVVGVRNDSLAELGAVEHREVRAVAGRRHHMRGIRYEYKT